MKYRFILVILLLFCEGSAFSQIKYNAYTVHENGEPTVFYLVDVHGNKYPRFIICPDRQESNVGVSVLVRHTNEHENMLWVALGDDNDAYCEKGSVSVNIKDYYKEFFDLYQQPHYGSSKKITYKYQCVKIYDECDGWLYIKVMDDDGIEVYGWIPPEMAACNPYVRG